MRSNAARIALAAVMIAVTAVFTLLIRVPTLAEGYFNFSDVAIVFAGLAFGPWMGFVAGGFGTAIADLVAGFAQFAVLSFLAHGLEGLIIGYVSRGAGLARIILAWFLGSLVMIAIYLLGEVFVLQIGWGAALAEVPTNALQAFVGAVVGIPLYYAVRRAYPPVVYLGRGARWREEELPEDRV